MLKFRFNYYEQLATELGYSVFKTPNCHLNIVGWRASGHDPNLFWDTISVYWFDSGGLSERHFSATTCPGLHYLLKPMNPKGAAILVPGQYLDTYEIGNHRGREALVQVKPVNVYRDNNQDLQYDKVKIETGLFGINIHRAGLFSKVIGLWSAGCQVFQKSQDFKDFMGIVNFSEVMGHRRFSYTLVEI